METRLIISLFAVSSALVSCNHKATEESSAQVAETVDVAIPTVENVTLSNVYPGYLTANSSVDVVAKVNGQIESKNFESGALVQKGQVLFKIDPTTYLDQVKQAEATLATANSTRDYAKAHYEAVKKALESDAVSKMEVIQAESAYEQAEASIKSATAALADARRLLGYCTVRAPITGRVADGVYDVGAYVSGQAEPVVVTTVYDNSSVSANFAIEDNVYHDIVNSLSRQDSLNYNKVPVIFEEPMPHDYTAEVSYLTPALNNSTGTLRLICPTGVRTTLFSSRTHRSPLTSAAAIFMLSTILIKLSILRSRSVRSFMTRCGSLKKASPPVTAMSPRPCSRSVTA